MAPRYHLINDVDLGDDLQSTSPHWVVGFARYANPVTYDPSKRASISMDEQFAYAEKTPLLVVDSVSGDCVALNVSGSKGSHTMSLSAVFAGSETWYLNEVLPGDWVVACIVYSEDAARRVADDMRAGRPINGWDQGLKFVGRVGSMRESTVYGPDGTPSAHYNLQGVAFNEFDSTLMYYPQLQHGDSIPNSWAKFGIAVGMLIRGGLSKEDGSVDVNGLIPQVMSVVFGQGAWSQEKFREQLATPNKPFIVPTTVCKWLGIKTERGTFADLMRVMVGVQKYNQAARATEAAPGTLFWPDQTENREGAFRATYDLIGSFPMNMVPQTNTTPWAFMSAYINEPLNESVVSLRPDKSGSIYPFFVLRQTPFTTEVGRAFKAEEFGLSQQEQKKNWVPEVTAPLASTYETIPTTRFLELPRWVVDPKLVRGSDLGRSDQIRQNLTFVYGSGPGVAFNEYQQFVTAGPVKDDLDILRNGVRPYTPSVNCFLRDWRRGMLSGGWRDIISDIVMGQHLTLNGTLQMSGVRAPIAHGDNIEFGSVVYHIENVAHSCNIGPDGRRNFVTNLALSRGVVDLAEVDQSAPSLLQRPVERSSTFAAIDGNRAAVPSPSNTKD